MLAGRTMAEAGTAKFDGDQLGGDPMASFAAIADEACAAATGLEDPERVVHCSFGDYTAREHFWKIKGSRGLRPRNTALVMGAAARRPDELLKGMWDEISPN